MPLLTFPLALILVSCFVLGSVVTWALSERRMRREREELEKQMTRALQTRYEMYEGLEQSVIKLLTRFEALESEFKQRLIEARNPRAALEQTVKLRAQNPELWDIEREHHRVQGEHLGQIAAQAMRIAELMTQMESFEATAGEHDSELAHVKARYETAVANFNESDKAASAKIERLESVVRELESFQSLHEAASRDLQSARASAATRESEWKNQVEQLQARIDVLALNEERVRQLEELCTRRETELAEQTQRTGALATELGAANRRAQEFTERCDVLTAERDAATKSLAEAQKKAETTLVSRTEVESELGRCRAELQQALQTIESRSTQLDAAVQAGRGSEERLNQLERTLEQSRHRVEGLEKELSAARADGQSRLNAAQAELASAQRALQSAKAEHELARARLEEVTSESEATRGSLRSKLAAIEGELSASKTRAETLETELATATALLAKERAGAEEQTKLLETALQGSQAQLALYRAKLNHHSSHVEEAWSVLSELKPMLASLEQKLKDTDEPPSALPAPKAAFDLSVLDEKPAQ